MSDVTKSFLMNKLFDYVLLNQLVKNDNENITIIMII